MRRRVRSFSHGGVASRRARARRRHGPAPATKRAPLRARRPARAPTPSAKPAAARASTQRPSAGGTWSGHYTASPGSFYMPDGGEWANLRFRGEDASVGLGEGTLEVAVDPLGTRAGDARRPARPAPRDRRAQVEDVLRRARLDRSGARLHGDGDRERRCGSHRGDDEALSSHGERASRGDVHAREEALSVRAHGVPPLGDALLRARGVRSGDERDDARAEERARRSRPALDDPSAWGRLRARVAAYNGVPPPRCSPRSARRTRSGLRTRRSSRRETTRSSSVPRTSLCTASPRGSARTSPGSSARPRSASRSIPIGWRRR